MTAHVPSAPATAWAFGVDPMRAERYSLRQARYHAIGVEVGKLIDRTSSQGQTLKLLDVGIYNGVSMRHIETHDELGTVEYHGVDLKVHPALYNPPRWTRLYEADLLQGLPFLQSNQFDVVICEQVLEHLTEVRTPLVELHRVLRPGGLLILGVPIFSPGLDQIRKHLVPVVDRLVGRRKPRGHVQAFSRGSFLRTIRRACGDVEFLETRGFRILSGGLLRPLENARWWWQLNCWLGRTVPGLCTELQVLATKSVPSPEIEPTEPNLFAGAEAVSSPVGTVGAAA